MARRVVEGMCHVLRNLISNASRMKLGRRVYHLHAALTLKKTIELICSFTEIPSTWGKFSKNLAMNCTYHYGMKLHLIGSTSCGAQPPKCQPLHVKFRGEKWLSATSPIKALNFAETPVK